MLPVSYAFHDKDVSDACADSIDNRCDAILSFSFELFLRHVCPLNFTFVSLLMWLILIQYQQLRLSK